MTSRSRHDPFHMATDYLEDLNDSSHSTMRVDLEGFKKNPAAPNCSSCHEHLPGPKIMAQHQHVHQAKCVRFSKVLHIREVPHRNEMSTSDFDERWGMIDPEISPSIFDAPLEELLSSEEGEEKKRKRQRVNLVRKRILSEFSDWMMRKGKDAFSPAPNYTRYSSQAVQEAHVAALKHAHDIEEYLYPVPAIVGAPLQRKRFSVTQPLAAVKRLRLS
jgi:hypothetical protein